MFWITSCLGLLWESDIEAEVNIKTDLALQANESYKQNIISQSDAKNTLLMCAFHQNRSYLHSECTFLAFLEFMVHVFTNILQAAPNVIFFRSQYVLLKNVS